MIFGHKGICWIRSDSPAGAICAFLLHRDARYIVEFRLRHFEQVRRWTCSKSIDYKRQQRS
jgi:hypothetical protein